MRRHGQARRGKNRTSVYRRWVNMRARCSCPNNPGYHNYGGRGITVCKRWDSFENFYADMGNPPKGMSLDRIDNDGNYEPSNCRWADGKTQSRNRRNIIAITFNGKTQTLKEWADELGLSYTACKSRFHKGWKVADIFTVAPNTYPSRQGTANQNSVLTPQAVYEIRKRRDGGETCSSIAKDFPMCLSTISKIGRRDIWKHLPEK